MSIHCTCAYKSHVDDGGSVWTTILEFLFSIIVVIFGVKLNYRFIQKLKEERKNKPFSRKGNVIDPIMRWFLWVQIIYWPYNIFYHWIESNEIIQSEAMNGWWCIVFKMILQYCRFIIAYNSLFVAAIRYLYIVHEKKANQWKFENVGRWMAITSFVLPITLETIKWFTAESTHYTILPKYNECIEFYQRLNNYDKSVEIKPTLVAWTLNYLPLGIVRAIHYTCLVFTFTVLLNVYEAFFYIKIKQNVQR